MASEAKQEAIGDEGEDWPALDQESVDWQVVQEMARTVLLDEGGPDYAYYICPHCKMMGCVSPIACGIVRHAWYKHNYEAIDPHMKREECKKLLQEKKVIGCARPVQLSKEGNTLRAVPCSWDS